MARGRLTIRAVRRLARRLGSPRAQVRAAAEAELRDAGPQAAGLLAAYEQSRSRRAAWLRSAAGRGAAVCVVAAGALAAAYPRAALAVAGIVPYGALALFAAAVLAGMVFAPFAVWWWAARRVRGHETEALRLAAVIHGPRALEALLRVLARSAPIAPVDRLWPACDRALDLFDALPDAAAAEALAACPEGIHVALRRCGEAGGDAARALRLIALIRRAECLASIPCLEQMGALPLVRTLDPGVCGVAAACAADLRVLRDELLRHAALLRPASAPGPADPATLLRPAPPASGEPRTRDP